MLLKSCFIRQWVTAVHFLWIFIAIPCGIVAFSMTTTFSRYKQGIILPYFYCKIYVLQTNDGPTHLLTHSPTHHFTNSGQQSTNTDY
jgi:hypothetical protein